MRKALVGLILAATVLTPTAALAQDGDDGASVRERYQRLEQRNQQRHEQRLERQEQRQQRQEARQQPPQQRTERREQRQERRQQRVERQAPQDHGERRRSRELPSTHGWQGPRTPETRRDADRYDRIARENAWRHGTEQQRRELRRERREEWGDRRDDRNWRDRRDDRDWRDRRDRRDWRRDWDRQWRNDRRYDWRNWRYRNRHHYRLSPYYSPFRNHRYSRFSIGVILGSPFYDQRYWIGDPWQYRLPAAPYGTQWVRYYNDVLLVDVYTGEVIDVIYDFFW